MWQWVPPPDPDKPDCPYIPGFEVDIESHSPPPPFGGNLYPAGPRANISISDEWMFSVTQTKHILAYPPLETPPPARHNVARLTVTKAIAIGNARGAQILLCSISPHGEGTKAYTAVAKVYDPLYYPFASEIGNLPNDVSCEAEQDYSTEAAAYECLSKTNQAGSFVPAFYGSWTFSLPLRTSHDQQSHQRHVRLVLIEHVDGVCMRDLFVRNGPAPGQINATHLSEAYRLRVLAILLDGVARQHHAGVDHRDLAPRNVMLVPGPDTAQLATGHPRRVVLLDYNIVTVWEKTKYGKLLPAQLARLPPSPMKRFWNQSLEEFDGWVPLEWDLNKRLRQEWLRREFGGEKSKLYEPLDEELELAEPKSCYRE